MPSSSHACCVSRTVIRRRASQPASQCLRRTLVTSGAARNSQSKVRNKSLIYSFPGVRAPEKSCRPLRVLFFGTDEFSVASLKVLHLYREELDIKSIDVVCKTSRPTGRGLKKFYDAPIKRAAKELSLRVHEIERFTSDWQPPTPGNESVNLLIAVSFGLLIPARIITGAQYGGLNLHPSHLPDFRGAAPLHYTLLQGRRRTAVSLQTLHPSKFDHGVVLARTTHFEIPSDIVESGSVARLRELVAPEGAELLVRSIHQRLFVHPVIDISAKGENTENKGAGLPEISTLAPKITKKDKRILWQTMDRTDILQRRKVLGPLWNMLHYVERRDGKPEVSKAVRVILHDLDSDVPDSATLYDRGDAQSVTAGSLRSVTLEGQRLLVVRTADGGALRVTALTLEGDKNGRDPVRAVESLRPGNLDTWQDELRLS